MEILVSKMDQNLVSISKFAKATELAPRLLGQSDSHSSRSTDTFREKGLYPLFAHHFYPGEEGDRTWERFHLKKWTEPKAQGLKAPVSHVLPTVRLFTADMGHNATRDRLKTKHQPQFLKHNMSLPNFPSPKQ